MFKDKHTTIEYKFISMTSEYAEDIAYKWKYSGKYSFYNFSKDKEELYKFLEPSSWNNMFAVIDDKSSELIGFTSYLFENKLMWIGLGLKPKYTGKGYGEAFVKASITFGLEYYNYDESKILLSVAQFNKRAIKTYEKVGFKHIESKDLLVNGKLCPFFIMGKPV